ncbi:MAG: LacI family DNA-binding transcriptional regulator [Victivallaceae bacterium]|nr:LacI family DNA-binding transcriptional regulator [Victivallaceae bacterium]
MGNVTLKKIAELSEVSIRTVSRALKNHPGVKPETGQRVLELAERLGYTPNIAARNLRLNHSNVVGIIMSSNYSNNVAIRKVNDLQKQLEGEGLFPLLGHLPKETEDLRQILQEWAGLVSTVVFLNWRSQLNPAVVLYGLPQQFIFVDIPNISDFHSLTIDRSRGIRNGIAHLVESGRRRIARCGNIPNRESGFMQAFNDYADKEVKHFYFEAPSMFNDGIELAPQLIFNDIDAVFFDTDRMAYGFLKYCWQHAIAVPQQIAVIGFDDDPWGEYSCPALSTVAHPIADINEEIVELALNPAKPQKKEFPTRFIKRESV